MKPPASYIMLYDIKGFSCSGPGAETVIPGLVAESSQGCLPVAGTGRAGMALLYRLKPPGSTWDSGAEYACTQSRQTPLELNYVPLGELFRLKIRYIGIFAP